MCGVVRIFAPSRQGRQVYWEREARGTGEPVREEIRGWEERSEFIVPGTDELLTKKRQSEECCGRGNQRGIP